MISRQTSQALTVQVNGEARSFAVEPRTTLLDALRNELGLTGPKKSCDRGECGACTVHIDGRRVLSCMTLAAMHDGQQITTIEGLERDGQLHPVQQAFIEYDGFQCGFCIAGGTDLIGLIKDRAARPELSRISDSSAAIVAHVRDPHAAFPDHGDCRHDLSGCSVKGCIIQVLRAASAIASTIFG